MKQRRGRAGFGLLWLAMAFAMSAASTAQDFAWASDFPVGSNIMEISAPDQDGVLRQFADLKGENGLLLMLSRSFDW